MEPGPILADIYRRFAHSLSPDQRLFRAEHMFEPPGAQLVLVSGAACDRIERGPPLRLVQPFGEARVLVIACSADPADIRVFAPADIHAAALPPRMRIAHLGARNGVLAYEGLRRAIGGQPVPPDALAPHDVRIAIATDPAAACLAATQVLLGSEIGAALVEARLRLRIYVCDYDRYSVTEVSPVDGRQRAAVAPPRLLADYALRALMVSLTVRFDAAARTYRLLWEGPGRSLARTCSPAAPFVLEVRDAAAPAAFAPLLFDDGSGSRAPGAHWPQGFALPGLPGSDYRPAADPADAAADLADADFAPADADLADAPAGSGVPHLADPRRKGAPHPNMYQLAVVREMLPPWLRLTVDGLHPDPARLRRGGSVHLEGSDPFLALRAAGVAHMFVCIWPELVTRGGRLVRPPPTTVRLALFPTPDGRVPGVACPDAAGPVAALQ